METPQNASEESKEEHEEDREDEEDKHSPSITDILQLKKKCYDEPSAESLPQPYKQNSHQENLYLWATVNYRKQVKRLYPQLTPLCLTFKNECKIEKIIMTYIKPTVLPFSHLFDIAACASFVSDFILYKPMTFPVSTLSSPTRTVAIQEGNSLEMSNLLVSLLTGFGFQAFVVYGQVDPVVARMDRSEETCKLLEMEESVLEAKMEKKDERYYVESPPLLRSKYLEFVAQMKESEASESSDIDKSRNPVEKKSSERKSDKSEEVDEKNDQAREKNFHAWAYVRINGGTHFFIEASTGERKFLDDPAYKSINSVWNHQNYWLNKSNKQWWRTNTSKGLDLNSDELWVKLVADLERNKRLLSPLTGWLNDINVPSDCLELMYRLGQRSEEYQGARIEYFAPYLVKEGTVQRVCKDVGKVEKDCAYVLEKFRFRKDRMSARELFPLENKVIERFLPGRLDHMKEHQSVTGGLAVEYVSKFYHDYRFEGLHTREVRDLELIEHYVGRSDGLSSMKVTFSNPQGENATAIAATREKKFGPAAERSTQPLKEVVKIVERFEEPKKQDVVEKDEKDQELDNEENRRDEEESPGRVLNPDRIMERVFDLDNERILIKFHREGGQIFCRTVEYLPPSKSAVVVTQATNSSSASESRAGFGLTSDDVKVLLVDPREEKPCLRELIAIYKDQVERQKDAVKRVQLIEKEMSDLLSRRAQELAVHELEVWLFDVKRNASVRRGRRDQQKALRQKERSAMDLHIDFLAPYLEQRATGCGDDALDGLSKEQIEEIKEECLTDIQVMLEERERKLEVQLSRTKAELPERNSRLFFVSLLEARLKRQREHNNELYDKVEKQLQQDPRLQRDMD